jgi:hypothetical protein
MLEPRWLLLASALLGLAATSARADDKLSLRVWTGAVGRYVIKDNASFQDTQFGTAAMKVDGSGIGAGVDAEYRLHRYFGIDLALAYTRLDVTFDSSAAPGMTGRESFSMFPLLLAANVHLVTNRHLDLWLGPQVGAVFYPHDLSFSMGPAGTYEYSPSTSYTFKGFNIGADIPLDRLTAVNVAFRFQDADSDPDGRLLIDPTFLTVGGTRKF